MRRFSIEIIAKADNTTASEPDAEVLSEEVTADVKEAARELVEALEGQGFEIERAAINQTGALSVDITKDD